MNSIQKPSQLGGGKSPLEKVLPQNLPLPHQVRQEVMAMCDEDLLVAITCDEINALTPEEERAPYQKGLPYMAYQDALQKEFKRRGLVRTFPKGCNTCIHFTPTDPLGPGWCASLSLHLETNQPHCDFYRPNQD